MKVYLVLISYHYGELVPLCIYTDKDKAHDTCRRFLEAEYPGQSIRHDHEQYVAGEPEDNTVQGIVIAYEVDNFAKAEGKIEHQRGFHQWQVDNGIR